MKKLKKYAIIAFMSLSLLPSYSIAKSAEASNTSASANSNESATATKLLDRLNVIREMNKSELNSSEKQSLRKEVRSIRSQLQELGGGIYLSVGAIIIIILLLILLL
jgi:hypothetical protein